MKQKASTQIPQFMKPDAKIHGKAPNDTLNSKRSGIMEGIFRFSARRLAMADFDRTCAN